MSKKPSAVLPADDDEHIVPIDYDPAAEEAAAAEARAVEATNDDDDHITDLEMFMDMLTIFDVEFTLVQDESGSTVEIDDGARGTLGFRGFAMTFNFRPAPSEKFTFIGAAR